MAATTETDHVQAMNDAARALQQRVVDAETKAKQAEEAAQKLQEEKDADWKRIIDEAQKLAPGDTTGLLKMLVANTRPELEEMQKFFTLMDGKMPIGLVRISIGVEALLNGVDTQVTAGA